MDETFVDDVVFDGLLLAGTTRGVALTQMMCVAVKLGIVDAVAESPLTSAELARRTSCHEPSLRRLLKALVGCSILQRDGDAYAPGPRASRLQRGTADSLRAPLLGVADAWKVWGELEHCIRTGEPAFAKALGAREWEFLKANPQSNEAFTEHMGRLTSRKVEAVSSYPYPPTGTVVDVGGRDGTLISSILAKNPEAKGILFDRPEMATLAGANLEAKGVSSRCRFVGGDFFVEVPSGGDVYLLSSVLHDWEVGDCTTILQNCRRAMSPQSRLLLVEVVLPDDDRFTDAAMLDINMMVVTGGKERAESDWHALVQGAGLRISEIVPSGDYSILVCIPR